MDLVSQLSKEQVEEIEESFKFFDKNGDGTIEGEELAAVMRSLGCDPSEEELDAMIAEFDMDGNGSIEYDEFVRMMAKKIHDREKNRQEQNYRKVFNYFDHERTGKISFEGLKKVMNSIGSDEGELTNDEIGDMIEEADLDQDGFVDFDEFVQVMNRSWEENKDIMTLRSPGASSSPAAAKTSAVSPFGF